MGAATIQDFNYCLEQAARKETLAHQTHNKQERAALLDSARRWFEQAQKLSGSHDITHLSPSADVGDDEGRGA